MRGARRLFSREKQVFLVGFSLTIPRFPCKSKNRLNTSLVSDLSILFLIFARDVISKSQKQNFPVASPVLTNSASSIVQNVLTSRVLFSFILTFIKIVEIKAVCSKHFNSPPLLFFPCGVISQPKVFWKVDVSKFFAEILEKRRI